MDDDDFCEGSRFRKHPRFAEPMWTAAGENGDDCGVEDGADRDEVKSTALQIAVQSQSERTLQTRRSAHTIQRVGSDQCR